MVERIPTLLLEQLESEKNCVSKFWALERVKKKRTNNKRMVFIFFFLIFFLFCHLSFFIFTDLHCGESGKRRKRSFHSNNGSLNVILRCPCLFLQQWKWKETEMQICLAIVLSTYRKWFWRKSKYQRNKIDFLESFSKQLSVRLQERRTGRSETIKRIPKMKA